MPVVESVATEEPLVALTFDDGPHPAFTPALLEALAAEGARATFFVRGAALTAETRELVGAAFEAGHEIGNHTHAHRRLSRCGERTIERELTRTHADLEAITGVRPTLVRPPYGAGSDRVDPVAGRLGYRATVCWSVDPADWMDPQPSADTIVARVLEVVRPGAIVLLHDGCSPTREGHSRAETIEATRRLIPALRAEGLEPATVSELLDSSRRARSTNRHAG